MTVLEWVRINDVTPIWTRKASDVTDEEYKKFFKAINRDEDNEPRAWTHFRAEGELEFRSILFVPKKAPSDLYDHYYQKSSKIKLYVRKVLITEDFEDLVPRYLNFVSGLVDSDDLPLNVSRETLQQHNILKVMGKKLVRKALEMLKNLAADSEKAREDWLQTHDNTDDFVDEYLAFWKEFSKNLKLGLIEDSQNRTKLSKLMRFYSTKSAGKLISFDEYITRMKENQLNVYYIAGESIEVLEKSPLLKKFQNKDLEVLFFTDPLDEYVAQNLQDYDNKKLQSIAKEGLKFGDEDEKTKRREKLYEEKFQPLIAYLTKLFGNKVEKVSISNRLEDSPCIIVTSQYGQTANMERIQRSQAFGDRAKANYIQTKKIFEINPRHPIFSNLLSLVDEKKTDETTENIVNLLYDTALLQGGFPIEETKQFQDRVIDVVRSGLKIDTLDLDSEIELPLEDNEPLEDIDEEDEDEEEEQTETIETSEKEEEEEKDL